jgi:hypothetical protein
MNKSFESEKIEATSKRFKNDEMQCSSPPPNQRPPRFLNQTISEFSPGDLNMSMESKQSWDPRQRINVIHNNSRC